MSQPPEEPQIVTHRIPRIEVYQVTDDELRRIEDGYGQVGQDLTFAVASLSFCIAFAIALATANFSERLFIIFLLFVVVSALVAIYTGLRWWRARKSAPTVIVTIRSRKVEPQVGRGNRNVAGRRTFCSFHYQRDVWRASIVRNAGVVDAKVAAGWVDSSIWEEAEKKGDDALKKLIKDGLNNTSVTVVLIGAQTKNRKWVKYEIEQSIERGNGLLGIHIHMLKDKDGKTDSKGDPPKLLVDKDIPCYNWDKDRFGEWVEAAAKKVGK